MNYDFREAILLEVRDYASHTPTAGENMVDCSLGINPYGVPGAVTDVLRSFDFSQISRYPHEDILRPAIVRYWNPYTKLRREQITLCNGSFLGLLCLNDLFAGAQRRRVVSFVPTFTDMLTSAAMHGMEIVPVPFLDGALEDRADALIRAIDRHTALVYLDRPNNPTGGILPMEQVEAILKAARSAGAYVLVDEAFADYLPRRESCVPLLERYDNLIITRTFSKGFGLADLRAGYLLTPPQLARLLAKMVNPFILPTFVRLACATALRYPGFPTAHQRAFTVAKQALLTSCGNTLLMAPTDLRSPIMMIRSTTDRDLQQCYLEHGILTVSGREFESLDQRSVRISIPKGKEVCHLVEATARLDH